VCDRDGWVGTIERHLECDPHQLSLLFLGEERRGVLRGRSARGGHQPGTLAFVRTPAGHLLAQATQDQGTQLGLFKQRADPVLLGEVAVGPTLEGVQPVVPVHCLLVGLGGLDGDVEVVPDGVRYVRTEGFLVCGVEVIVGCLGLHLLLFLQERDGHTQRDGER
jgi:hypothetical protein